MNSLIPLCHERLDSHFGLAVFEFFLHVEVTVYHPKPSWQAKDSRTTKIEEMGPQITTFHSIVIVTKKFFTLVNTIQPLKQAVI